MTRTVYTVTARAGGGPIWTPIGTATVDAEGTVSIALDALPASERLVIPPEGAIPASEISSQETSVPSLAAVERATLQAALDRAGGNVCEAARLAGIGRTTLYRKISDLGLSRPRKGVTRDDRKSASASIPRTPPPLPGDFAWPKGDV